jgi:hypothetical protein
LNRIAGITKHTGSIGCVDAIRRPHFIADGEPFWPGQSFDITIAINFFYTPGRITGLCCNMITPDNTREHQQSESVIQFGHGNFLDLNQYIS